MNYWNDRRPTDKEIRQLRWWMSWANKRGGSSEVVDMMLSDWDPKGAVDFSRMLATIAKEAPKVDPDQLDEKQRQLLKGRIKRARKALIEYREWLTDERTDHNSPAFSS